VGVRPTIIMIHKVPFNSDKLGISGLMYVDEDDLAETTIERIPDDDQPSLSSGPTSNPKLRISIGLQAGFIKIEFDKPVERLIMTKQQGREFARRLIQETL
jgi:hypothetical protein